VPAPTAIVLAAGASSRMGALKPLLDLEGRSVLARAVGAFTGAGVEDVVVVTGHRGAEVAAAASALGARPVANPHFEDGMFSSVQAGAAAVPEGRRFFLLPVDCPLVRPETVGRVARTAEATGAAGVVPVHDGRAGHPPLLGPELRSELLAARPTGGLRELLAARRERIVNLEVDDPGVLHDADTPGELEALRRAARREELPSRERCFELLAAQGASPALVAHAKAVAAVATALAAALNERCQYLCRPLVEAAALLHDVARAEPQHAHAGAGLLDGLGYPRLAPLVRVHMHLGEAEDGPLDEAQDGPLDEAQVVYLADKLVLGDRLVSLEERFADRLRCVGDDPAARDAVLARRAEAQRVLDKAEDVLSAPVASVIAGVAVRRRD
jgi:molybdenum cofactor cytidylyltransferase